MFRAELDALPICEKNDINYRSKNQGISHTCGHDGHMTILLGIASYLHHNPNEIRGKIILLFQPSEEIAEGANKITSSSFYKKMKPDYIYALHNIPGYPIGDIVIKNGFFTIASKGLVIELKGVTAHAGHPEQGINPVFAMAQIIDKIKNISEEYNTKDNQSMITIVHAKLGEIAFGTSPGNAIIMATLRAPKSDILTEISKKVENFVSDITNNYSLSYSISYREEFPAISNHVNAVMIIEKAAKKCNMNTIKIQKPFSWTEDFSYFTKNTKGAMFGIGAGIDHAPLHSQYYDFPDDILNHGINIFLQLIREINS
jgi:amidohydrolase